MTKYLKNVSILHKKEGDFMLSLEFLVFEVTRLCNEFCKMCMRGDAEDVNMTKEIVNRILLGNDINDIYKVVMI